MKTIPLAKSGRHVPCRLLVHVVALAVVIPALADVPIIGGPVTNSASGHIYYLLGDSTWTDAEAKAVSMGGHLVTINDADEDNWVYTTFSSYGGTSSHLWIGLSDHAQEGTFVWSSGEPVGYTQWNSGEPNAASPEEDYVHINAPVYGNHGTWNDHSDDPADSSGNPFRGVVELVAAQSSGGVPVISSYSPSVGSVGTLVSIVGMNFSPVASENVVRFGAVQANAASANETNLTVTVPVGATYAPVTVTVAGLTAIANQPFLPTFAGGGGGFSGTNFSPRVDIPGGDGAKETVVADIDGDGMPDLIVGNAFGHTISVYKNVNSNSVLATSSFVLSAELDCVSTGEAPFDIAVADVDGDGKLDILASNYEEGSISVYRNECTPGNISSNLLATRVEFSVGSITRNIAVADIDLDGKPDVLTANGVGTFSVLRNTASPGSLSANSFAPRVDFISPDNPIGIAAGDIDGDGKPDVVTTTGDSDIVSVFRNTSSPGTISSNSFAPRVDFQGSAQMINVAIGDLDGDGRPDLSVVSISGELTVLRNTSEPGILDADSFAPEVGFPLGGRGHNVVLSDVDGDGKPDIVVDCELESLVSVFRNLTAPGSFSSASLAPRVDFPTGYNAWGVSAGDLNSDGRPDVVFCNTYDNTISLYENIVPLGGPPVITSQPTNQAVVSGENVTFSVSVTGLAGGGFQWWRDMSPLAGATNQTLILTNAQSGDAGSYRVVVTNLYGSTVSSNALLTVNPSSSCEQPPSGLVAWWQAEGDALDRVADNDGVLQGAGGYGTGKVGQAFVFDGTTGHVRVASSAALNVGAGAGMTIEGWINPSSVAEQIPIAEWNNGNAWGVHFWISQSTLGGYGTGPGCLYANIADTAGGNHFLASAAGIVQTNVFQHVALTFDKTSGMAMIYLNGAQVAQKNLGSNFTPQTSYDFYLAARVSDPPLINRWAGMDEFSLYNRALTSNEIHAIHSAGAAGKCSPAPVSPTVVTQPTNQTVVAGGTASFTVTASGDAPLWYQWHSNNVAIANATNSTLTLTNVQLAQAGHYSVVVTNLYGTTTSSNALLIVNPSLPCVAAPSGLVAWWRAEGNTLDGVGANDGVTQGTGGFGTGKVGQSFVFDGTTGHIRIASNATLNVGVGAGMTIEGWIKPSSVAVQRPIAEWNNGSAWGVHFWISQSTFGGYGTGPGCLYANFTDTVGGNHFLASAAGLVQTNVFQHVALTFDKASGMAMIFLNGVPVAQKSLGSNFTPQTTYDLYLAARVSDPLQVNYWAGLDEISLYSRALTSNEIQAVYAASSAGKCPPAPTPPEIVAHPTNVTVVVGGAATFNVIASGTSPLSYQWRSNNVAIAGATNATLTLNNVQYANAGSYSVVVTNLLGSDTSSNAVLTVLQGPAQVRVSSITNMSGAAATVPIILVANGDESALSFSLDFDTQRLTFTSIDPGADTEGAAFLPNTINAGTGRIGVTMAMPSGTFPAGNLEVAVVHFDSAVLLSETSVVTPVRFTNQPIPRLLSDASAQPLPVNFVNGTVTLLPSEFEADTRPRPGGNRELDIFDWVQVGLFVAGIETPTNATEFQRADCAPRSTLGDGQLKVTDWVQAGRYAALLDPITVAGGPTSPVVPTSLAGKLDLGVREIRVDSAAAIESVPVTLPVHLEAQGNESALGFSLVFDSEKFTYSGVVKGTAAASATLNVNTNETDDGRIGIVLGLPFGNHFASGTRELVRVSLKPKPGASGSNAVLFGDTPVIRSISDSSANELTASFATGSLIVNPLPTLEISTAGDDVVITWPAWALEFTLQTCGTGSLAEDEWTNHVGPIDGDDEKISVTIPITDQPAYFRLRHP
ncbi:MAG TPA: FG-GAP-like repeat-containing protein [Verrucomicrobiota bacterium]|nr:FG-GAP-like repeat-containing protein [Verrucomicrobiota bacterium]